MRAADYSEEWLAERLRLTKPRTTMPANTKCAPPATRKVEDAPAKRRKYGNTPTLVDGIRFDSKKESERYIQLRQLESAGVVSDVRCQVPFEFNHGRVKIGTYKADFTYLEDGALVVEDVKSVATRDLGVFRLKKRLMLAFFGIEVRIS